MENRAEVDDHRMMQRIIALLFSLACTAFRASTEPAPARRYILCLLRAAAACGRDAVMGIPIDRTAYAPEDFMTGDDSPEDAMRLAQTLCVLAVLHHYLLAQRRHSREDLRVAPGQTIMVHPLISLAAPSSSGGGGCVREVAGQWAIVQRTSKVGYIESPNVIRGDRVSVA